MDSPTSNEGGRTVLKITSRRKVDFCAHLLSSIHSRISFLDIGSEGFLKHPWTLIPEKFFKKIDFDPLKTHDGLPTCVSDVKKKCKFFIARKERASSLHPSSLDFVNRFGMDLLLTKNTIDVMCVTTDDLVLNEYPAIDVLDISVEGHDFQVLKGAEETINRGDIKIIKANFQFLEMWKGQGWFSDIDQFLRSKGYELAHIEIVHKRPAIVQRIIHKGHPIAGRAFYVPSLAYWKKILRKRETSSIEDEILKAVVLYVITDVPGLAFDLLDAAEHLLAKQRFNSGILKKKIFEVYRFALLDSALEEIGKIGNYLYSFLKVR